MSVPQSPGRKKTTDTTLQRNYGQFTITTDSRGVLRGIVCKQGHALASFFEVVDHVTANSCKCTTQKLDDVLPSPRKETTTTRSLLSKAEKMVVKELCVTGGTNEDIAKALFLSVDTVKKHLANIAGKLKTNTRTATAVQAIARGLIEVETPDE